jgi:hypothetical protein
MQLFEQDDISPYVRVNFNTPAIIDAIVDDVNQKRLEEGVPQTELPSRPLPPHYTREPHSSSSTSFVKTAVAKRNLPSTTNVTFADTDTTLYKLSTKKLRSERPIEAQTKNISKHLQKVETQRLLLMISAILVRLTVKSSKTSPTTTSTVLLHNPQMVVYADFAKNFTRIFLLRSTRIKTFRKKVISAAMLYNSLLPYNFWGSEYLCSNSIRNRIPITTFDGITKTLYELVIGEDDILDPHISKALRPKNFLYKCHIGFLVGYTDTNNYNIYVSAEERKVIKPTI